ncbi:MAG: response regulator [Candidatus Bipolaricaulota bacterium]
MSIEHRMVILVVEDEDQDYELIERSIRAAEKSQEGISARTELYRAADGAEALDFLFRKGEHTDAPRPNLILLDLRLPKLNGMEVLEKIKQDNRLRKIPVVVLTVSTDEEEMVRAYDSGAAGFLNKPTAPEQFSRLLSTVLEYWRIARLPE